MTSPRLPASEVRCLTHSISLQASRQKSEQVRIGDFCFVGTGSVLLPGSVLPSCCVLGAGSVLNQQFSDEYTLYQGNPALPAKKLDENAAYFHRRVGRVD